MIEKIEEKESVGFVVAAASDTVDVIGVADAVVVTVLRKLNGGRWRQHLVAADLYEAE